MGSNLSARIDHAQKTGVLSLQDLKLSKVPAEVKKVAGRLRTLSLLNNDIRELPAYVGDMVVLRSLTLDRNRLQDLPPELAALKKLESLAMSFNHLSKVPQSLCGLRSLKTVSLSHNSLVAIPEELCTLPKLTVLDLSSNRITEIPEAAGQLKVSELNLDRNQIPGVPLSLRAAKNLKVLRLEENCLSTASFPKEFLEESPVSLIAYNGNPLTLKQFGNLPGYEAYEKRFTATKLKQG